MKAAYVILIAVALAFVVWDIITGTFDIHTFLALGALIALTIKLAVLENQEQQS